ncbi:putative alliinase, pyridoxal phosphate-dependent transferase, major domain-containing protein [Helianthus annuus]|nr:putative alliinase, pyridoxal phosphate-dependent transferase, major domain-containing protein [Helianthus annuus]
MFFNSENFQFESDTNSLQSKNSTNNQDVIEFVTSPNNPDGELKKRFLEGRQYMIMPIFGYILHRSRAL